jgi:DNA-binding response OmpR family regulator
MPEKILIVDDERAIAQLTALWIKQAGYAPITAFDGRGGLAAAATHRPDLILLDIRMPDLDGFEVHRQLKLMPDLAGIPVIFLSAHAQEAARQEAIARGASFFLPKPYDSGNLLAAVRAALQPSGVC